jgi:hypothetical protein
MPLKILLTICAAVVLSLPVSGLAAEGPGLNVVAITFDTLRADHLGHYGYASIQIPNIDEMARSGPRFAQACTASPVASVG